MTKVSERVARLILEGAGSAEALSRFSGRKLPIQRDPSHEYYFQIPVLDHGGRARFVNLFKPEKNPKQELMDRLQQIVRSRRGYEPGDIFTSEFGYFMVTDTFGIEEI